MLSYYEKLLEYWKAGNTLKAYTYFEQWREERLLTPKEIETLEKIMPTLGQCLLTESKDNPQVIFELYELLKKKKQWDDKTLSEKLKISMGDIRCIRNQKKPKSKMAGQKIALELLNFYKKGVS